MLTRTRRDRNMGWCGSFRRGPYGPMRAMSAACLGAALSVAALAGAGCENAGQGAVSGAGVGALTGLAIGSMSGNAGTGAAIGAIGGGVGGAVVGDQNRRANQRAATPTPVMPPPAQVNVPQAQPMSQADRDRLALARFARSWRVTGWQTVDGQRRFVNGNAAGSVDNMFFVRLDMSMFDEQSGRMNTGNVILASEPGRGITMNSRFDTSPSPSSYAGTVSADGTLFTLDEIAPNWGNTGRRIVIRFLSGDQFVADVTERSGGQAVQTSSLTFSAAR